MTLRLALMILGLVCTAAPKPNFVIIFTDDQGYADLGCFGGEHVSTPRIDRMAAEGAKLTSFYVAVAVCIPSRAALMTGCYPKRIGLASGVFGKWHLGDQPEFLPTRQGFYEFFGLPYSHDIHPFHTNNKKYPFPPLPLLEQETVVEFEPHADYLTKRFTEGADDFVGRHKDEPFSSMFPIPFRIDRSTCRRHS